MGNAFALTVLPGFIAGSFLGALHLDRWLALGALPPVALPSPPALPAKISPRRLILSSWRSSPSFGGWA